MNICQVDQSKCTGCFTCENVCPNAAIHLELNDEGFYYPVVNGEKCVDCSICVNRCPIEASPSIINTPLLILSAYAQDDTIRLASSSGGIFAIHANKVLSVGGIVYGAAFDSKRKEVCHTSTDNTPLADIMRSKYVQSRVGEIYTDVEIKLQSGRLVLFSGTPCQIKGLRSFLKKEYSNLFTIDFMCHGVPSTGLFKDVIDYYERTERSKVLNITFREKDRGWFDQVTKVYLSNGKVLSHRSSYYYYYYLFLNNQTIRLSCLDCSCYNTHESDITLADNWSISGDNKGVSLVLVNTIKGSDMIERISNQAVLSDYSAGFSGFEVYRHDYNGRNRAAFFYNYRRYGFDKTLVRFSRKAMRKSRIIRYYSAIAIRIKRLIKGKSKQVLK